MGRLRAAVVASFLVCSCLLITRTVHGDLHSGQLAPITVATTCDAAAGAVDVVGSSNCTSLFSGISTDADLTIIYESFRRWTPLGVHSAGKGAMATLRGSDDALCFVAVTHETSRNVRLPDTSSIRVVDTATSQTLDETTLGADLFASALLRTVMQVRPRLDQQDVSAYGDDSEGYASWLKKPILGVSRRWSNLNGFCLQLEALLALFSDRFPGAHNAKDLLISANIDVQDDIGSNNGGASPPSRRLLSMMPLSAPAVPPAPSSASSKPSATKTLFDMADVHPGAPTSERASFKTESYHHSSNDGGGGSGSWDHRMRRARISDSTAAWGWTSLVLVFVFWFAVCWCVVSEADDVYDHPSRHNSASHRYDKRRDDGYRRRAPVHSVDDAEDLL